MKRPFSHKAMWTPAVSCPLGRHLAAYNLIALLSTIDEIPAQNLTLRTWFGFVMVSEGLRGL